MGGEGEGRDLSGERELAAFDGRRDLVQRHQDFFGLLEIARVRRFHLFAPDGLEEMRRLTAVVGVGDEAAERAPLGGHAAGLFHQLALGRFQWWLAVAVKMPARKIEARPARPVAVGAQQQKPAVFHLGDHHREVRHLHLIEVVDRAAVGQLHGLLADLDERRAGQQMPLGENGPGFMIHSFFIRPLDSTTSRNALFATSAFFI